MTTQARHTAGPWNNNKWNCEEHQISAEADANSALIAASPELLAACKALLEIVEQYRRRVMTGELTGNLITGDCEPTFQARAAIAKAEGQVTP